MDLKLYERMEAKAEKIGTEHGRAAASWYFDGNTPHATYAAVLEGIEAGDPLVLDTFPSADLSGEWADGYTPRQLAEDVGLVWAADEAETIDGLCDAYELAFNDAVDAAIEEQARYHVEEESEAPDEQERQARAGGGGTATAWGRCDPTLKSNDAHDARGRSSHRPR